MNDLTTSRNSLLNPVKQTSPLMPFMSIDASELSFRKIQAASEPLIAQLQNAGVVKEVVTVFLEESTSVVLCPPKALFFGSVFIDAFPRTTGCSMGIDVATVKSITATPTALIDLDVTRRRASLPFGEYGDKGGASAAACRNALISAAILKGPEPRGTITAIGLLIVLKDDVTCRLNFPSDNAEVLGLARMNNSTITYDNEFESSRGVANYWDASSAATGLPGFLKPKKLHHKVSFIQYEQSSKTNVSSTLEGIVLPKNFVGFLQFIRAKLRGAQLDPTSPIESRRGFDALLSDILVGINNRSITLTDDPTKFIVPSFDFNEPYQTGFLPKGDRVDTSTFFLGFDTQEPTAITLNRFSTSRAIVGECPKVVALSYPLKNKNLSGHKEAEVAHDLVQLNIKQLTLTLPVRVEDSIVYHTDGPLPLITPEDDHRFLAQYAYGFRYPEPLVP